MVTYQRVYWIDDIQDYDDDDVISFLPPLCAALSMYWIDDIQYYDDYDVISFLPPLCAALST